MKELRQLTQARFSLQVDFFSTDAKRLPASSLNSSEQVRKLPVNLSRIKNQDITGMTYIYCTVFIEYKKPSTFLFQDLGGNVSNS
jgi:hypothetical protein